MNKQFETILESNGQIHLLQFWDELDEAQRDSLAGQIENVDFDLIARLLKKSDDAGHWAELAAKAQVPPAITLQDFADPDSFAEASRIGGEAISQGKVAMILVAGGQGSRLGFDHPKGMFPIGPLSDRTLYQMHIEQVIARAQQFDSTIPLYVLSSPPTHEETSAFLADNNNFGLASQNLKVFCQGTMPAVDADGKILLADKDQLFVSPDGHGGTLAALVKSGCLQDMQDRGIEHVFYGQVDNPLIQICHPALIGYHIKSKSEMTSQVVRKSEPLQKVGNVVKVGEDVQIIEYSDLPEQYACQTNADGSLELWAGSIAVHIFETEFLFQSSQSPESLPFHRAHKKVPFIDESGAMVDPAEPNATKFERFIFDLLPTAKNAIVCEVAPSEGFCAVKNAPPAASETPAHVKQAISDLHSNWLASAGVNVEPGVLVEINPLFAVDGEQLAAKVNTGATYKSGEKLTAGTTISEPTYLI